MQHPAILPNVLAVSNKTKGTVLCSTGRVAESFLDRGIGLLMTPVLNSGDGLWLSPCSSIHTFFMGYPIDVAFLDAKGTVLACKTYKPWRMSAWISKAQGALELPEGTLASTRTTVGDVLEMKRNS